MRWALRVGLSAWFRLGEALAKAVDPEAVQEDGSSP